MKKQRAGSTEGQCIHTGERPQGCCRCAHTRDIHRCKQRYWKNSQELAKPQSGCSAITQWWFFPLDRGSAYMISQGFSLNGVKCHLNSKWMSPKVIPKQTVPRAPPQSWKVSSIMSWTSLRSDIRQVCFKFGCILTPVLTQVKVLSLEHLPTRNCHLANDTYQLRVYKMKKVFTVQHCFLSFSTSHDQGGRREPHQHP